MGFSAGAVYATLGGKFDRAGFDQFGSSMYRARGQMEAAEKRMVGSQARVNESMRKMGQTAKIAATGGVIALGAAIAGSVKVAADFDKSMRNVNSIAGLNERQFRSLSKSVLELSGKTAQAPKTLADGMYQLVSSGFNARDSLKILKSSAVAASAGLTNTETATTAVAAALNAYHLPASKAQEVSDQLFQTVNRGVITFEELSHTIGMALPFANSLHIGLGQVGAAISTLTKEGIPAAEASTYLKNAMVAFLKPSKDLQGAIKATGAESGEALVKQKGFQGALEAVAKQTDGTKAGLQKLFPDIRASAAAFALTGSNAKTAEGDVKAFGDTGGATQKVFAEQSKSAAFQWNKFKAELQAAGVVIGSAVLPVLTKGITAVAGFVEHLKSSGQLASFGHSVAAGFKEAGQVFSDIASVGGKVAGVFLSIGRALDLGNASHLEALLAAIAGFKIAGVVTPLIMGLANGISTLVMNAASAPTLAAFFADLPFGPVGLISAAVAGLAAGIVLLGNNESAEAKIADHSAQAHRDQAAAIKSVSDAEAGAADAGLRAKQTKLDAADATKAAGEALKKYGRHSDEYKRALLDQQVATLEARSAQENYNKSIGSQNEANIKRVTAASKALAQAQKDVADTAPRTHATVGGRSAGGQQDSPSLIRARADAQANLTKRTQEYVQALARSNVSDVSRQRLMNSASQITEKNARGVSLLVQAMQAVPKNVQSKILVDNQGALSKAGQLAFELAKLGQQHTVTTILSNTTSARAAVAAFKAVLAGVPPKKVSNIVASTHGKAEIDALNAAIDRVHSKSAQVTVTTSNTVLNRTVRLPSGKHVPANAAGRPAGAAETSLVGEGAAPEWVVNAASGDTRWVTGPTMMNLAREDYVIPTESKYRGRALGLLGDLAASMGFATGRKPGELPDVKGAKSAKQKEALQMMRDIWGVAAPYYGQEGAVMPRVWFTGSGEDALFVGTSYSPGSKKTFDRTRQVMWPDWINKDFLKKDPAMLNLLIHEWAHYFQKQSLSEVEAEGGAQAFARKVSPQIFQALGIPYANLPFGTDQYTSPDYQKARKNKYGKFPASGTKNKHGEVGWVTDHRSPDWIMYGQFGRKPPGYAGGRKGHHRYVPKPGHYLRLSPDQFDAKDQATQQHLDQLRQDATQKDSKGHHTSKALAAQKHLHAARVARDKAHADLRASKRFAAHIAALEQDAEIAGTDMGTADSENNQKAYDKAKSRRRGRLDRALSALLYEHARAKPGSQWERDIRQALAQVRADVHDAAAADSQATQNTTQTGMTAAEQTTLSGLNAQIALAALTPGISDDITAGTSLTSFLTGVLAEVVKDPKHRGGNAAITDIAGQLKTARDNLTSLADPAANGGGTGAADGSGGATGATPDQQALIDQANLRASNAEAAIASQAAVIRAFGSPGDIGTGTGAGTAAQIVFQSYVPPSPQEALRLANYVVGGIDYQGASSSPRDTLGV